MSTFFSIKDLENITGIKAHTIRIWEKRYQLLSPNRTDTNIRSYNMESLKKLLNISFLVSCGYKISRISKLNQEEINEYLKSIISDQTVTDKTFNHLKFAMLNFDNHLLNKTFDDVRERFTFNQIFYNIFIPFLNQVGLLWQSSTINSSHEHFISNFIKQKLWLEINLLQQNKVTKENNTYVLFLPEGEINDMSLLFLNNLLLSNGHHTIYLGSNISQNDLTKISKLYKNLIFLSHFTVAPSTEDVNNYVTEFKNKICDNDNHEFWILGNLLKDIIMPISKKIKVFYSFNDFENELK